MLEAPKNPCHSEERSDEEPAVCRDRSKACVPKLRGTCAALRMTRRSVAVELAFRALSKKCLQTPELAANTHDQSHDPKVAIRGPGTLRHRPFHPSRPRARQLRDPGLRLRYCGSPLYHG